MYFHLCGRTNDTINTSINCPTPKPGHTYHATLRRRYGWSEVNCAEAWNGGMEKIAMWINVDTNLSKKTHAQIIQPSTVAPRKTITTHPDKVASGIYLMRQTPLYTSKAPTLRAICSNGADIISAESAQLEITSLPNEATTARVLRKNHISQYVIYCKNVWWGMYSNLHWNRCQNI